MGFWNLDLEERGVRFAGKTTLNVTGGVRVDEDLAL